jgi:predicted transcriptional regulator
MPESNRVQRWREAKRQAGLRAVTIWLTHAEELRLKDLAATWHCSPSAMVQQALAQFTPAALPGISAATDTTLLRQLIREELAAMQATLAPATATATVIPTDTPPQGSPLLPRQDMSQLRTVT